VRCGCASYWVGTEHEPFAAPCQPEETRYAGSGALPVRAATASRGFPAKRLTKECQKREFVDAEPHTPHAPAWEGAVRPSFTAHLRACKKTRGEYNGAERQPSRHSVDG
jgi:hypothetical protein